MIALVLFAALAAGDCSQAVMDSTGRNVLEVRTVDCGQPPVRVIPKPCDREEVLRAAREVLQWIEPSPGGALWEFDMPDAAIQRLRAALEACPADDGDQKNSPQMPGVKP